VDFWNVGIPFRRQLRGKGLTSLASQPETLHRKCRRNCSRRSTCNGCVVYQRNNLSLHDCHTRSIIYVTSVKSLHHGFGNSL